MLYRYAVQPIQTLRKATLYGIRNLYSESRDWSDSRVLLSQFLPTLKALYRVDGAV